MRSFPVLLVAGLLLGIIPAPVWGQQLHCNTSYHPFGKVVLGTSATYTIDVVNTGTSAVNILSDSISGGPFFTDNLILPITVNAGGSFSFNIIFTPTAEGYLTGNYKLATSIENYTLTIDVSGNGVPVKTELQISPAALNFGTVKVGSSMRKEALLTAVNGEISISSGQSTSSEFAILWPKMPVKVAAGKSVKAVFQFTPTASGTASEKAGFISTATHSPTVALVIGTGMVPASKSVDLSWEPGTGDPVGYNLYRSTTQTGPFSQINTALDASTSFTDSSVTAGTTYYYVATAVNAQGEESPYSNLATAKVP